ncbi:family 16 glycoside hydrolase [Proteiniphilum sp.]|uniref:family 16 glycoside hydrolase n=1 Tax=Proteiniphilum sp. TaxID=1926877 RepID=UPI0033201D7C
MKHIQLIILCLSLLITSGMQAQLPEGRTKATVIADALAQLPADTPHKYNQIIADLVSTGEEGLLDLIGRMNPPGNQSNETIDYAISGWTHFVANDNAARNVAAGTYEKALTRPLDKEVKAFVIRQLRTIGTDDNVDALSAFLTDKYLSDPTAQALVSIGTEKAANMLLVALASSSDDKVRLNLVNAIGQLGYEKAEPALLGLLSGNSSEAMQKVLLNALGNTGSKASLKPLRDAAEKAGYVYQKDNSTASYISLLGRLNDTESKLVKKEAEKLLATGKKLGKQDIRIAATKLLLAQPTVKKEDILKNAIKDGDITYLSGVLNLYPFENDKKSSELIQATLVFTKSPEVQTALVYWSGKHDKKASIPQIATLVNSPDDMVQKAAALSLAKLGGEESLIALASLLKSDNDETVALAKDALSTYNGDISYTLASVFEDSGDAGKKAILELIAIRKMESQYNLVYNQMFGDNKVIKSAAAHTLKDVSTDRNLADLFTLLERADATDVPAIQQAINAALDYLLAEKQLDLVTQRMKNSSNKHLYYSALANSESKEAMDIITNAYATATGAEKEAAFDALTHWKSFHVIYPMLDIARNSQDKRELEKVTDALISAIRNSKQTGAIQYLYLREAIQFAQTGKQKNDILRLMGNTGQYQAMLFVAPYMDEPTFKETAAMAAMNIAINNPSFAGTETTRILNKASKTLSNPDADYQRQSIAKYLAENPAEGGFVSLFNGGNLDGWKGLVENPIKRAKMSQKELAAAQAKADKEAAKDWKVEDGNIIFDGKGYDNLCTDKQYGDFEMLVDWKLYPGPEPDAGIYLRGTPQVQIWDTARTNVGAEVGSGGLYNNQQNPSKPLKVADQKVGEWNTFLIRMVGERVSVWLNGELVTDNVILENYWDRTQPIFPVEQIELQAHGSKVAYRDIFIKEIPRPEPFKLSSVEEKEGFRVLFDGTNLDQWTGNKRDYAVESGNIVLHPSKGSGGNLYTNEQFDNFIFRFEFMLTPGANNGLGIRTPLEGDAAYVGMELQILDNDAPVYEKLAVYQYHGSVYGVIPAKRGFLKPLGEWNYQEVIADGDHIKVILNGTTILDGNIREASKNGTMDKREHPGLLNKTGHIGFLGHGSKVMFRNIRIKELK